MWLKISSKIIGHERNEPEEAKEHSKHLIFLIDGTWLTPTNVEPDSKYSNVYRLNELLKDGNARDGKPQIVFYSRGIGAVPGPMRYLAGGFAYGLLEEIEDVYINIASNYVEGDKIYIFGFSRGAVIANVVARLIASHGLLYATDIRKFKDVWNAYVSGGALSQKFLYDYCHPSTQIEFLGVFDTVYGGNDTKSGVRKKLKFAGAQLPENVKSGIHILALNEQRPFFRPLLWDSSATEHPGMQQIWMPGVHSDIGGCYSNSFFGDVSLLTMLYEVNVRTTLAFEMERPAGSTDERLFVSDIETSVRKASVDRTFKINNEWDIFWKLASGFRSHLRKLPSAGGAQKIHGILDILEDEEISVRDSKSYVKGHELRKQFGCNNYNSYPVQNWPSFARMSNVPKAWVWDLYQGIV